jgi:hypothetical protein
VERGGLDGPPLRLAIMETKTIRCRALDDPSFFGTHSLRRTKATLVYRHTSNPRAVELLGGFPAMTGNVPFLMKDVVLLAASLYLLKQDLMRVSRLHS